MFSKNNALVERSSQRTLIAVTAGSRQYVIANFPIFTTKQQGVGVFIIHFKRFIHKEMSSARFHH